MSDDFMPEPTAEQAAPWLAANSLVELGELTAQWLEGTREYHPFHANGPDEETSELVQVLARLNRAGFWTQASQPGEPIIDGNGQRAAVDAFCSPALTREILRALAATDLVVLAIEPGMYGVEVVATLDGGEACTWWGNACPTEALADNYLGPLSREGVLTLLHSWQVHVIDPVWGRNDVLWPALLDAVTASRDATS